MKIILTQEVENLGAAGDVVEVKDGYGRNYLIPRGFGIRWTARCAGPGRLDQGRPLRARGPRRGARRRDQGQARGWPGRR